MLLVHYPFDYHTCTLAKSPKAIFEPGIKISNICSVITAKIENFKTNFVTRENGIFWRCGTTFNRFIWSYKVDITLAFSKKSEKLEVPGFVRRFLNISEDNFLRHFLNLSWKKYKKTRKGRSSFSDRCWIRSWSWSRKTFS